MSDPALQAVLDASRIQGPDNSLGFWMWRLSLTYQRRVEATLSGLDLTHLQFLILVLTGWLEATAPPVRQTDVAAISGVQAAQVSLMVKSLKAKKLLTQQAAAEDTRVRHIALTPAGVSMLAKATPLMGLIQEQLWPPGADTDTLLALMKATLHRWTTDPLARDRPDWNSLGVNRQARKVSDTPATPPTAPDDRTP